MNSTVYALHRQIPCAVLLLASVAAAHASAADQDTTLFAADGYRIDNFRSPVPDHVPGAQTLDTVAARALIASEPTAVFIDVLPRPPRPAGLSATSLWIPPPHHSIPGSTWLPNVGYGRLSDELDAYFRHHLQRLSDGRRDKPLVIFCQADCWMSWNAARRAAEYGYARVFWYPDGTDGWTAAGLTLAPSTPAPSP